MKSRKEVMDFINKQIVAENGKPMVSTSKLSDSGLDSLGLSVVMIELDIEYGLLKNIPDGEEFDTLNLGSITASELIDHCKRAYMERNVESDAENLSS